MSFFEKQKTPKINHTASSFFEKKLIFMRKTIALSLLFFLSIIKSFSQDVPKAKVVFIRTFNYFGGGIGYNVFDGSKKVVRIRPQTFEVIDVDAKPTRFWAKTEVKKHLDINMLPNNIYIVRCKAGLGIFLYRPSFETMNEAEFSALVNKKKFLQKKLKANGFNNAADFLKTNQIVNYSGI